MTDDVIGLRAGGMAALKKLGLRYVLEHWTEGRICYCLASEEASDVSYHGEGSNPLIAARKAVERLEDDLRDNRDVEGDVDV